MGNTINDSLLEVNYTLVCKTFESCIHTTHSIGINHRIQVDLLKKKSLSFRLIQILIRSIFGHGRIFNHIWTLCSSYGLLELSSHTLCCHSPMSWKSSDLWLCLLKPCWVCVYFDIFYLRSQSSSKDKRKMSCHLEKKKLNSYRLVR